LFSLNVVAYDLKSGQAANHKLNGFRYKGIYPATLCGGTKGFRKEN
jgi:hypothetical protein